MKNYLTILLLIFVSQSGFCQDRINTKDKKQLNVQIIEQTPKMVRYKMLDYDNGPILTIKSNHISSIEYKNGFIDRLGNQNPRKNRQLGINAGVDVEVYDQEGLFTGTLDYFIIPQIDVEINFATTMYQDVEYFSAGGRFHLNTDYSEKRITPFAGLLIGARYGNGFWQVPIGINYVTNFGFNASLSINERISYKQTIFLRPQSTFLELRIGWRFKV